MLLWHPALNRSKTRFSAPWPLNLVFEQYSARSGESAAESGKTREGRPGGPPLSCEDLMDAYITPAPA